MLMLRLSDAARAAAVTVIRDCKLNGGDRSCREQTSSRINGMLDIWQYRNGSQYAYNNDQMETSTSTAACRAATLPVSGDFWSLQCSDGGLKLDHFDCQIACTSRDYLDQAACIAWMV